MWIIANKELKKITDDGLYRIRKAQTGTYYIQKIIKTKKGRYRVKDIIRISDHYTKNNNGYAHPPCKTIKHVMKQIIVKSIFNIEHYN